MATTPAEMWDAALTLENDGDFYRAYKSDLPEVENRRNRIKNFLRKLGRPEIDWHAREQVRRYLDDTWDLPKASLHGDAYCDTVTIEFWRDEVRDPRWVVPAVLKPPKLNPASIVPVARVPLRPGMHFATGYKEPPGTVRARHGTLWTEEDKDRLARLFWEGYQLDELCAELGRAAGGVKGQLITMRLLRNTDHTYHQYAAASLSPSHPWSYTQCSPNNRTVGAKPEMATLHDVFNPPGQWGASVTDALAWPFTSGPTAIQPLSPLEQSTMNIIEVTTKTLINGQDAANLTDTAIYNLIADQEKAITDLEAIKNKPKKLVAEIAKRKAGIQALVDFLDSKEPVAPGPAAL